MQNARIWRRVFEPKYLTESSIGKMPPKLDAGRRRGPGNPHPEVGGPRQAACLMLPSLASMGVTHGASRCFQARPSSAMQLRSKRQLKEPVLFCPQHIRRLENANRFPKRPRLSNGPRSRGGWIESEVMEWLQKRIDDRNNPAEASA